MENRYRYSKRKYNNGWFVGYVITNHDKYYFATHLSDGKPSGKNAELISEKY